MKRRVISRFQGYVIFPDIYLSYKEVPLKSFGNLLSHPGTQISHIWESPVFWKKTNMNNIHILSLFLHRIMAS